MSSRDGGFGDGDKRTLARKQRRLQNQDSARDSPKTSRQQAGGERRTVAQMLGIYLPGFIDEKLTRTFNILTDTTPLPSFFDYGHMFESYAWRAVFLTSFTLGIRFGNFDGTSDLLLKCFGIRVIFIITYLILPLGIIYGSKLKQKDLNIHEKRVVLIGLSSLLGMLSSVVNQHYITKDTAAPSYFLPCLIGLTIQLVGPHYGHDRVRFLAVSVGSAFAAGLLLMAIFRDISFGALLDLTLSAISAVINLQFTLATIKHGGIDVMAGHQSAVLMALFQHLSYSRLHGKYSAVEKARPSVTKPLFYS